MADYAVREVQPGGAVAVGRFHSPDGNFLLPMSLAQLERAQGWFRRHFESLGIGAGDAVLLMMSSSEFLQFGPLHAACRDRSVICAMCEPFAADAYRSAALLRGMKMKAAIGLTLPVVEGWEAAETGSAKALLDPVPRVFADAAARTRLASLGVRTLAWADIGATLALECATGAGLHFDAGAWTLDEASDGLRASSLGAAVQPVSGARSFAHGRIDRAPCACGSADPRVVLAGQGA